MSKQEPETSGISLKMALIGKNTVYEIGVSALPEICKALYD
jgi:hypothetical protein